MSPRASPEDTMLSISPHILSNKQVGQKDFALKIKPSDSHNNRDKAKKKAHQYFQGAIPTGKGRSIADGPNS